jgi:hypothetical protein
MAQCMSGALGDFALISMADKYIHRDMALRGSGANRRRTRTRAGQRRYAMTNTWARIAPAGRLQLSACRADNDAQRFSFCNGAIRRVSDGKCLDVLGAVTHNRLPVQAFP